MFMVGPSSMFSKYFNITNFNTADCHFFKFLIPQAIARFLKTINSLSITFYFFFLYIQFTLFKTKSLQSPGTYISKRTWDST